MTYNFDIEIFTSRLKLLRQERGLSKVKLGKALGFTDTTIGRWESGIHTPNIEHMHALASFFNVDSDYLIGRKDAPR